MELLLNATWLGLSAALLGGWVFLWRSQQRAAACAGVLAVGCLLLFPVISITDDLHPAELAVDEVSSGLGKASAAHSVSAIVQHDCASLALLHLSPEPPAWTVLGHVRPIELSDFTPSVNAPSVARAPPVTG